MPVGIQRLNARRTQPNPNIVFIKPLPGPDSATAQDFLERIAAQCLPIMKEHHISVVTLEEHEPNREFVGRNFNAGEVIQLVLRSAGRRRRRRWLPFRYVQMVMMHELAHCAQMNHSRAFWAVRDAYAARMAALWARGYTGEGVWGRGVALGATAAAAWERDEVRVEDEEEPLPEHLCGGTYRSTRRRRRQRKPEMLSWRERRDARVAKRFGTAGTALGADEQQKMRLEGGRRVAARPRVAGSARGRELRAAAALARFDKQKVEEEEEESGSDEEEEEDVAEAVDWDGKRITDGDGRAMVKVCGDEAEGEEDQGAARRSERDELRRMLLLTRPPRPPLSVKAERDADSQPRIKDEPSDATATATTTVPGRLRDASPPPPLRLHDIPHIRDAVPPPPPPSAARRPAITIHRLPTATKKEQEAVVKKTKKETTTTTASDGRCPLCSLDNGGGVGVGAALRCAACAHVLRPEAVHGAWACGSASCAGTGYVNAGDCGVCGLCGGRKP